MDESRMRHREMIQRVVDDSRATASRSKAGVTLASALLLIAAKDTNEGCAALALFRALSFWRLNAYCLRQERLFRTLHKQVAKG
ncbi:MAG: hypothetical protein HQ582_17205 [Planctomycetes bacterium]|nr:hypothetical protein [Planctomycetota bacterium]